MMRMKKIKYLRTMEAGNTKRSKDPAVAPVNSKACQILGMNIAPYRITDISINVTTVNLQLSEARGLVWRNIRPSKLSLKE